MADLDQTLHKKNRMVNLGGTDYKVGELDLGDWAKIEGRAKQLLKDKRNEKFELAKEAYPNGNIPAEVFKEVVRDPKPSEVEAEIESVEMSAFILVLVIKKKNHDMSEDDILGKIRMSDIAAILGQAGIVVEEKKTATAQAPSGQNGQQQ